MKALALLAGCALLGWWLVREIQQAEHARAVREAAEAQQRAAQRVRDGCQRFLRELYADIEVEVSEFGVFVPSQDVATVAEVVASNPAFYARVA